MATLLYGDCLSKMKALPDKSIDLFLCDLPYGCLSGRAIGRAAEKKKMYSGNAMGCAWDIKIDLTQFWAQVKRLCKDDHTPVLMFCSTKFGVELINSNPDWFRYDLVWNKMRGVSFLQANKMPMRSHEMVYVFAKKGANYTRKDIEVEGAREWKQFGKVGVSGVYDLVRDNPVVRPVGTITSQAGKRCVLSVVEIAGKSGTGKHPTQKPEDLYAWLIERYSREGDTVLDPTAGSFASVFTAARMGRKAIGIEMDRTFFAKAIQASFVNLTDK
jgi:site-specific DNA-methyltransferase (adenine-specific)